MKLPGINYQTAVGPDVSGLPLQTARAWSNVAKTIGNTAMEFARAKDEESARQQLMDDRMSLVDTVNLLQSPLLTPDQIPSNVNFSRTEKKVVNGAMTEVPRENIPTHEVQQQILDNHLASLESRARETLSPRAFDRYKRAFDEYAMSARIRNSQAQLNGAKRDQTDKLNAQLQGLQDRGLWDDARTLANTSQFLTEGEKALVSADIDTAEMKATERAQKEAFEAAQQLEMDELNEALIDNDIGQMRNILSRWQDEKNYAGTLTPDMRRIGAGRIRTAINAYEAKLRGQRQAADKGLKRFARESITALNAGEKLDPIAVARTRDALIENGDVDLASDLNRAAAINEYASDAMETPLRNRDEAKAALLRQVRKSGDPALINDANKVVDAIDADTKRIKEDTIGRGLARGDVDPVNFNNLADSLMERRAVAQSYGEQLGFMSGYLADSESDSLNALMENASAVERMQIITQTTQGMGGEASKLWQQVAQKDAVGVYSGAGVLAAENRFDIAESALRGADALRENPQLLSNQKQEIENNEEYLRLNAVYGYGSQHRSIVSTVRARYADLLIRQGSMQEFDDDLLEKAIDDVTGGIEEYNNTMIVNPNRNQSIDDFVDYLDDQLDVSDLEAMGKPEGFTYEQLIEQIRNGEVRFQQLSPTAFALIQNETGNTVRDVAGGPFRFTYDADMFDQKQEMLEEKRKAEEDTRPPGMYRRRQRKPKTEQVEAPEF